MQKNRRTAQRSLPLMKDERARLKIEEHQELVHALAELLLAEARAEPAGPCRSDDRRRKQR
jgi:hypothetical protein